MSPSCYSIAVDGETRCEKHLVKRKKEVIKNRNRDRRNAHIYDSTRWRVLSKKYRVANPLCEVCLAQGIETYADVVDHIVEIEDDPSLAFVWSNLMSMDHACHAAKTSKEKRKRYNKSSKKSSKDGLVFV